MKEPDRKTDKDEATDEYTPSEVEIQPAHGFLVKEYYKDPTNTDLYVIFNEERCPLVVNPDTEDLQFIHGNNRLLVKDRHVVLTVESNRRLQAYVHQRELKKAEEEAVLLDEPITSGWERDIRKFRKKIETVKGILGIPEVNTGLQDFEQAIAKCPYQNQRKIGSSYRLLKKHQEGGQALKRILEYLYKNGYYKTIINKSCTKQENMVLYLDGNGEVEKLILEIAEILGCKTECKEYLDKKKRRNKEIYFCIYDHGDRQGKKELINSACVSVE